MNNFPTPQEIEHQLTALQHEASPLEARTCLFNLVVFQREAQDDAVTEALNYLHGKRPARVILIHRAGAGETWATVAARCVEDSQHRGICIQEILIRSGTDGRGESPLGWGPLLIREIPTFLWWQDDPKALPDILKVSRDLVDRVIFDSSLSSDPLGFYRAHKDLLLTESLADLAWDRIHPLQKLTAQLFNPGEMRSWLEDFSRWTFKGGTSAEAILFLLWMGSKLGLGPVQGSPGTLTFRDGSLPALHVQPGSLDQGFEIVFETHAGQKASLKSQGDGFARLQGLGDPYFAACRPSQVGESLLKEVDRQTSDRLYAESMGIL